MKTAIIHPNIAFGIHKQDEWDSFRAEGRFPINIGFGLSLLGYDVNIVFDGWKSLDKPKKTWNNIQLSRAPIRDYYDVALSFTGPTPLAKTKFGKGINMGYEPEHIIYAKKFMERTKIPLRYACPNKYIINRVRELAPFPVYYLPVLYPIPSINVGFLPCSYSPKLPELKVYLHYTSWPQNLTISGDRFANKEQFVINYLKSKGFNVNLSILVENREAVKRCPINNERKTFFYSNECSYFDIINLIRSSDICITNGSVAFPGNGLNDIVSLGKPLIYIADGLPEPGRPFVNPLYSYPEYLIYIQEPDNKSIQNVQRILNGLIEVCKKYADIFRDSDFNTWKNFAIEVFDK